MSTQTKSAAIVPTREAFAAEIVDSVAARPMSWGVVIQLDRQLNGIGRTEQVTVAALQTGSRILANATMSMSYALHVSAIAANAASLQGEEELVRMMHLRENYIENMSEIVSIAAQKLKQAVEAVPESSPDFSLKNVLGL